MKNIFKREMTVQEKEYYDASIKQIKERSVELLNELDRLIENYDEMNQFEIPFYLKNSDLTIDGKIKYFNTLMGKISNMYLKCDEVRVRVATPLHPMCWFYHLTNLLKKTKYSDWFSKRRMFGFCVPYLPGKPIMLAHYAFESEYELHQILAHELTHSLMGAKDYNATNYEKAIDDAWTLCFLF